MSDDYVTPEDLDGIPTVELPNDYIIPDSSAPVDESFSNKEKPNRGWPFSENDTDTKKPKNDYVPMRRGGFKKPLTDVYVTLGTMWFPFDPVCGQSIIDAAPQCAEALESLAKENQAVRRVLLMLCETSAWGMVITAHLPIILAVAMHHMPTFKGKVAPDNQVPEQPPAEANGNGTFQHVRDNSVPQQRNEDMS